MASKIAQLRNITAFATLVDQLIEAPVGQDRMGCFYGNSGWGKTTAVSAAQILYDVIAVEVIENTSKMDVLEQILKQIKIKVRRDVPSRVRAIAEYMDRTNRPLVIDDAQYLIKKGMIGIARDIYNTAGCMVPVILVGEELLPQKLTAFENIHNRISVSVGAEPCSLEDARRLAEVYAEGIDIDDQLIAEFVAHAHGATRRVSNMISQAREIARSNGSNTITRQDWGTRPFVDGQPPTARRKADLEPQIKLIAPKKKAVGQ